MKHNNLFIITAAILAIVAVVLAVVVDLIIAVLILTPLGECISADGQTILAIAAVVPIPLLLLSYGFWRRHILGSDTHRFVSDISSDYEAYANKEKSEFAFKIALRRLNRYAKQQAAADPCWAEIRVSEALATWKGSPAPGTEDWEE